MTPTSLLYCSATKVVSFGMYHRLSILLLFRANPPPFLCTGEGKAGALNIVDAETAGETRREESCG